MSVTPSTLFSNIFTAFYNRLTADLIDPVSRNQSNQSTRWIFSSFPDADIDAGKIKYPLIIIEPINGKFDNWTLTKNVMAGSVNITVYSTSAAQADNLLDQIQTSIDGHRRNFRSDDGLGSVLPTGTDSDWTMRGSTKIHFRNINYQFTKRFSSGVALTEIPKTLTSSAVIAAAP